MEPDDAFNSGDIRDLRVDNPEGLLMATAAKYRSLITEGTQSQHALLHLVWELAEEGVNLPRVMDEHPQQTREYFGYDPGFSEAFISELDHAIRDMD